VSAPPAAFRFTVAVALVMLLIPVFTAETVNATEVVSALAAARVTENVPSEAVVALAVKLEAVPALSVCAPETLTVAPPTGVLYESATFPATTSAEAVFEIEGVTAGLVSVTAYVAAVSVTTISEESVKSPSPLPSTLTKSVAAIVPPRETTTGIAAPVEIPYKVLVKPATSLMVAVKFPPPDVSTAATLILYAEPEAQPVTANSTLLTLVSAVLAIAVAPALITDVEVGAVTDVTTDVDVPIAAEVAVSLASTTPLPGNTPAGVKVKTSESAVVFCAPI
jgi:hypothetical protein